MSIEKVPTTESDDLALALSGGGVRAALFSLGVIIGFIETQYHQRIRCVTSVSGGSILNAALAHAQRLERVPTVKEFESVASSLAMILAQHGTFVLSWRNLRRGVWYLWMFGWRVIGMAIPLMIVLSGFSAQLAKEWGIDLSNVFVILHGIPLVPAIVIVLAVSLGALVYFRGLFQEKVFREVVSAAAALNRDGGKHKEYVRDWGSASDGDNPKIMHVMVATDLLSGEPMYFSRQFVHCRPYGWSPPNDIRTTEALYSSAAFPVVFPPKKLRLTRLNFVGGEIQGDVLPSKVLLADGGVYNNLGTEWFRALSDEQSRDERALEKPCGGVRVDLPPRIKNDNIIVVNAGAPSQRVTWLWPGPFKIARIMSVLYDNTVRPRVELLQSKSLPVIDIQQSPLDLAESLRRQLKEDADVRAEKLAERLLQERTRKLWDEFSHDTASTKTKLSRANPRGAARLMLHGYLSSLVLLHVRFGANLPQRVRGEKDFLSLMGAAESRAVLGIANDPSSPALQPPEPPSS